MAEWGEIGFQNPIIVSATILGDIISLNWDGGPVGPSLGFPNPTATQGYYLDAGDGIAQFQSAMYTPQYGIIDRDNNNDVIGVFVGDSNGVGLGTAVGIPLSLEGSNVFISAAIQRITLSADEVYATLPAAYHARLVTGQSIAGSGSLIVATYTTTEWTTDGGIPFDGAGTFTMPHDGVIDVVCSSHFSANATGWREINIDLNGSMYIAARLPAVTGDQTRIPLSAIIKVEAGDTVRMRFAQNSGNNLSAFHRFQISYRTNHPDS